MQQAFSSGTVQADGTSGASQSPPGGPSASHAASATASRLMWFFAIVYVAEGLAQTSGILHQPLYFFLMDGLHWNTAQVSYYMGILGLPWMFKPLYGLVSDTVPLFGYRRKSYMFLFNLASSCALLALTFMNSPDHILVALLVVVFGMAASSALCGALVVEHGKASGLASKFCSQQTLWVNLANIVAALLGGWLCHNFSPAGAFHLASAIALFAPLLVVATVGHLIVEPKTKANVAQLKSGMTSIYATLRTKSIWGIAGFLFLWAFNPGFGAPLYAHMKGHLDFDQGFIGTLAMCYAAGAAFGGYFYMKVLSKRFTIKTLAATLIFSGALIQASFIFMSGSDSAIALQLIYGFGTSMALLNAHVIAANRCPSHAEGFMYGILLSTANVSFYSSQALGGYLYEEVFHGNIQPLILISAGVTLSCLLLLPFFNFEKPVENSAH